MISIILPTMLGREDHLARCLSSISKHTTRKFEVIFMLIGNSWGAACAIAAEKAVGDYLFFFSDDMEVTEGWEAALEICDAGMLPAPAIYNPDGTLQSGGAWGELRPHGMEVESTVLPLLSRAQYELLGPMPPIHFADAALSDRARAAGIKIVVCHDYKIIHHNATEGRRTRGEANGELARWRQAC